MACHIDLNQLAEAGSAQPGLLHLGGSQLTRNPQARGDLNAPDSLLASTIW